VEEAHRRAEVPSVRKDLSVTSGSNEVCNTVLRRMDTVLECYGLSMACTLDSIGLLKATYWTEPPN
jgi:hypothetical protein